MAVLFSLRERTGRHGPSAVPVGVITALAGRPVFCWILVRQGRPMKGISVSSLTAGYGGRTILRGYQRSSSSRCCHIYPRPEQAEKHPSSAPWEGASFPWIRFSERDALPFTTGTGTHGGCCDPVAVTRTSRSTVRSHYSGTPASQGVFSKEMKEEKRRFPGLAKKWNSVRDRTLPSLSGGERQGDYDHGVIAQEPEYSCSMSHRLPLTRITRSSSSHFPLREWRLKENRSRLSP